MERALEHAQSLPAELTSFAAELHGKCSATKFSVTVDDLARILGEVVRKYAPASNPAQARDFCKTLKLEELVLARACAAGNEKAWETFLIRYREKLYETGLQIAREDSAARDLADSLYADLYGTTSREGVRVSKLNSYTGRGSLEGWLRTVMAQEHVNRYRKQKRLVSLDEESEEGGQFAAPDPVLETAADPKLVAATDAALAALSNDDRFVLAAYYLDGRTLAEVARILGVHESTISRKVDKLAKSLRKQIVAGLLKQGMSRRQADEALEVDVRDISLNLRARLVQDSTPPTFPSRKERAPAGDGTST
jgi:RNA polymerase sigma-70 factor (ECF subfamily)